MLVIDEVSYICPTFLGQIDNRLRQIMAEPETPFGGVAVMLMGDFFQLPPVGNSLTLFRACVQMYQEKKELENGVGPKTRGTALFGKFEKLELTQQMRAALDLEHTNFLNRMRTPLPQQPRISTQHIKNFKTLSQTDVINDVNWNWAPIVVTSNKERVKINDYQTKNWARFHQIPRFIWEIPILGRQWSGNRTEKHKYVYENYPAYTGCFVAGAPGYLTENINPTLGLSNGTQVKKLNNS